MSVDPARVVDYEEGDPALCGVVYALDRNHYCTRDADHDGNHADGFYEWPQAPDARITIPAPGHKRVAFALTAARDCARCNGCGITHFGTTVEPPTLCVCVRSVST